MAIPNERKRLVTVSGGVPIERVEKLPLATGAQNVEKIPGKPERSFEVLELRRIERLRDYDAPKIFLASGVFSFHIASCFSLGTLVQSIRPAGLWEENAAWP